MTPAKVWSNLNSTNFDLNEHSYSPASSLTVFSIANMHVRTSKSQPFLGSESGSEYNKQQQQNTLIADTITGNPVVYIVGYKKKFKKII